jgi:hypothetical protein
VEYQGLFCLPSNHIIQPASQISVISPGLFKTPAHAKAVQFPSPTVYSDVFASKAVRERLREGFLIRGDPVLGAQAIFRFSTLESPPVRWAMGKDSIGVVRAASMRLMAETDEFESWSDDFELPA